MRSSESGFSCLYNARRSLRSSRYSSSVCASSSCCLKVGPQGSSGRCSLRAKSWKACKCLRDPTTADLYFPTHSLHLLLEGVNDELEEGVVLFLLLGKLPFGLASLLPQLCQIRVVGLLLLLGLPLPVGQVLKRKHRTITWYINSYKGKPLHLILCDEVQGCDYILVHTK